MSDFYFFKEVVSFAVIGLLEDRFAFSPRPASFLKHGVRNLSLRFASMGLFFLLFSLILRWESRWGESAGMGILYHMGMPAWLKTAVAFLCYDFMMYVFHRASHEIPFLWRLHRVHHSDPQVDATTAFRFHPGEAIASLCLFRVAIFPLIGITFEEALLYEVCFKPLDFFHHSRIRMPSKIDRLMRLLMVSPNMHRLHHSRVRAETDSNYGSFFSFWDRFGRTFQIRRDAALIACGLEKFDEPSRQSVWGMLKTPFVFS